MTCPRNTMNKRCLPTERYIRVPIFHPVVRISDKITDTWACTAATALVTLFTVSAPREGGTNRSDKG